MKNKKRETIIIVITIIALFILLFFWFPKNLKIAMDNDPTNFGNPATKNCIKSGYTYEIRETELGNYGVCIDSSKNECEVWELFNNNCKLEEKQQ
jgi:putative hemolysin